MGKYDLNNNVGKTDLYNNNDDWWRERATQMLQWTAPLLKWTTMLFCC